MPNAVDVASYVINLHGPLNYTVCNYAWQHMFNITVDIHVVDPRYQRRTRNMYIVVPCSTTAYSRIWYGII